jgi:cytochrome c peroxidase
LNTTQTAVRSTLNTWGPGKFDAELFLDGKAFNPQQVTDGIVTGTNVPGATLIPPAFGLGGVNLHTWTGWGSVPHWNAFVATLEMHGNGRFWDPRLNDGAQFPIAATHGFGDLRLPNGQYVNPDSDMVTSKLQALQFFQLAIPAPQPPSSSFDSAAAARGDELFSGKAKCNNCHVEPLWTDPGWNLHTPTEVCIDSFQANRGPDRRYRTSPSGDLFTHFKGGFYHDGRFGTLMDVVNHYNRHFRLGLTEQEKGDLIEYLKSI